VGLNRSPLKSSERSDSLEARGFTLNSFNKFYTSPFFKNLAVKNMLVNTPIPSGEYRHNYIRLAFLLGTLLLFVGHVAVSQLFERGSSGKVSLHYK
jgi:hypothetical protein